MATDPVQFSLMMNNRPQSSLDKAQQRNNEVFQQTMQAMSMAQRSQQMQQQQEQFNIVHQLRMKESEFNQKRSLAEASLAEKRIGFEEKQLDFRKSEYEHQLKDRELSQQFYSQAKNLKPSSDNYYEEASKLIPEGVSPSVRQAMQSYISQNKLAYTQTKASESATRTQTEFWNQWSNLSPLVQAKTPNPGSPNFDPDMLFKATEESNKLKQAESLAQKKAEQAIKTEADIKEFKETTGDPSYIQNRFSIPKEIAGSLSEVEQTAVNAQLAIVKRNLDGRVRIANNSKEIALARAQADKEIEAIMSPFINRSKSSGTEKSSFRIDPTDPAAIKIKNDPSLTPQQKIDALRELSKRG